jgi:hypothetical protein
VHRDGRVHLLADDPSAAPAFPSSAGSGALLAPIEDPPVSTGPVDSSTGAASTRTLGGVRRPWWIRRRSLARRIRFSSLPAASSSAA